MEDCAHSHPTCKYEKHLPVYFHCTTKTEPISLFIFCLSIHVRFYLSRDDRATWIASGMLFHHELKVSS